MALSLRNYWNGIILEQLWTCHTPITDLPNVTNILHKIRFLYIILALLLRECLQLFFVMYITISSSQCDPTITYSIFHMRQFNNLCVTWRVDIIQQLLENPSMIANWTQVNITIILARCCYDWASLHHLSMLLQLK